MPVKIITAPSVEPISLSEAKLHCRVDADDTAQDDLITALIKAVREYGEVRTQRKFIQQTLEFSMRAFKHEIELPFPRLINVEHIKYTNDSGGETTVDASVFQVDTRCEPGRIKPAYGQYWPGDVRTTDYNAVRIRYNAGYPPGEGSPTTDALLRENVPESIKTWMKARVADLYLQRETFVTGTVAEIPYSRIDGLLGVHRVDWFN